MQSDIDLQKMVADDRLDAIERTAGLRDTIYQPAYRYYLTPWHSGLLRVIAVCIAIGFLCWLPGVHIAVRFCCACALAASAEVRRIAQRQDALIELYRMKEQDEYANKTIDQIPSSVGNRS